MVAPRESRIRPLIASKRSISQQAGAGPAHVRVRKIIAIIIMSPGWRACRVARERVFRVACRPPESDCDGQILIDITSARAPLGSHVARRTPCAHDKRARRIQGGRRARMKMSPNCKFRPSNKWAQNRTEAGRCNPSGARVELGADRRTLAACTSASLVIDANFRRPTSGARHEPLANELEPGAEDKARYLVRYLAGRRECASELVFGAKLGEKLGSAPPRDR